MIDSFEKSNSTITLKLVKQLVKIISNKKKLSLKKYRQTGIYNIIYIKVYNILHYNA